MPNGIGNRATWLIGQNSALDGGSPHGLLGLPNLLEFGSNVGMGKDDTAAINAAIKSLSQGGGSGKTGGAIYAPPPSTGFYLHEGELDLKERANIRIVGGGALTGGGGVGGGGSANTLGSTVFIYGGSGARGWDMRSSLGICLENCHCLAWGNGFTGPIWDLSGTEPKPAQFAHFVNSRAEATTPGGKGGKILHCIGTLLDFSNIHTFDNCLWTSCLEAVIGVSEPNHSSVGHRFNNCFFVGNQARHVANPQESWNFTNCIAESLFNDKGEISNLCLFIGYNMIMKSHAINVEGCWAGSNVPAARAGNVIEARGDNWTITGCSLNTSEVGVFFPEGPIGSTVTGNRLWKLNSGILVTGKTIDSIIAANRLTEGIELLTDTIKERVGSIIQTANGAALLVS